LDIGISYPETSLCYVIIVTKMRFMEKKQELLLQLPLFRGIGPARAATLIREIPWREKTCPRGGTILFQEDPYRDLTAILEGQSYAEMTNAEGKMILIEEFSPPCLLAPAILFASRQYMPGSVIARSDCRVVSLDKARLLDLCSREPLILENFLGLISDRFVFLSRRLSFLSFKTIREKVMHYLLSLRQPGSPSVHLPLSMEELAGFFGVTRPALSRVFSELESRGEIRKVRREVFFPGR